MNQLMNCVAWLELKRLRTRLWMLLVVLLFPLLLMNQCSSENTSLTVETSGEWSSHPLLQLLLSGTNILALIGVFLGFLVLATFSWRGREEWESGQFQLVAMGQFHPLKIEICRFLVYFTTAVLFFGILFGAAFYYATSQGSFAGESVSELMMIAGFNLLYILPIFLSVGIFVSALSTAYYQQGRAKLLTLLIYIGLGALGYQLIDLFEFVEGKLFEPYRLGIKLPLGNLVYDFYLHFEFLLLSVVVSAVFLLWAGKILDEVES